MNRDDMLAHLARQRTPWDFVIIGGGATGAGLLVDAASRGYSVLLLEQSDFGKGTSSRSTKLVHGGVRYLAQGHIPLVMEALRERSRLRANAPHLVADLPLVVPAYAWWEKPWYGAGLSAYDALAGRSSFGRSRVLSAGATRARLPTIVPDGLRGGIEYHDGQFDDARLLVQLMATGVTHGGVALNYAHVSGLSTGVSGAVDGVVARDLEGNSELRISARVVVNATGAFVDGVRRMAQPDAAPLVVPSQGIHLVFDRSFLPGDTALMVPRVGDGRVMFAIPWQGHTLVGTTDTAIAEPRLEPEAQDAEVASMLDTIGRYLRPAPTRADVLSVFAGVRPLAARQPTGKTAAIARDHALYIDPSGLVTTTGGKWTTYRRMAEVTIDRAAAAAGLPARACVTAQLPIAGQEAVARIAALSRSEPELGRPLHAALATTAADIVWATRHEMARTVEDALARRSRALFLNAAAAATMAEPVAALMARELGREVDWQRHEVAAFTALAASYRLER